MNRELLALLPQVRIEVLKRIALGDRAIGLSSLVLSVARATGIDTYRHSYKSNDAPMTAQNMRSRFTSSGPKTLRGKTQWCLNRLAISGLVFTRRKPESGVQSYEHGERDKYWWPRMTKERAIQELTNMKIEVPIYQDPTAAIYRNRSAYSTASLE